MRRTVLLICCVIAVTALLAGCQTNEDNVAVIDGKDIKMIRVECFDKSSKEYHDEDTVRIVAKINEAKKTGDESTQDIPDETPLGTIIIDSDEGTQEILYYYKKENTFYIENHTWGYIRLITT